METREKTALLCAAHISLMALAAAGTEVFLVLLALSARLAWAAWARAVFLALFSVLNAGLLVLDIVFYLRRKEVVYKACITLYVMFLFFGAVAYALLETGFFAVVRDEKLLEEYLERSGSWMTFLFTSLQFLQVVVLPIPSTVTVVAGTATT